MKLTVSGGINRYYAETLCLIYFPGEKFPEDDTGPLFADFKVSINADKAEATVTLGDGEGIVTAEDVCEISELSARDKDKAEKIAAGRAMRKAGAKFTGYDSPWGILTGVRPAKLATYLTDDGFSKEETAEYLSKVYSVKPEKAKLAVDVSVAERPFIESSGEKDCSIYVSIPFCPSKCRYCSFVSVASPGLLKLIPDYTDSIINDIENTVDTVKSLGLHVASVYFGGGTPTILTASQTDRILSHLFDKLGYIPDEVTYESGRPDTITDEKLEVLKAHSVTRMSVNTQTLNDDVLEKIGRAHTSEDFFRCFDMVRSHGMSNVNVDLIAGLPGESSDSFRDTVARVAELRPEAVTVHTFSVKKASEFAEQKAFSRESLTAEKSVAHSSDILSACGYIPYYMYRQKNTVGNLENVGYSLPGHESAYNIYMMEEVHTVFGIGASAVTRLTLKNPVTGKTEMLRLFEPKYPYEYLNDYYGETGRNRRETHKKAIIDFYNQFGR